MSVLTQVQEQYEEAKYLIHLDNDVNQVSCIDKIHKQLKAEDAGVVIKFTKKAIVYSVQGRKFGCVVPQSNKILVGPLKVALAELEDTTNCRSIKSSSNGGDFRLDIFRPYDDFSYAVELLIRSMNNVNS